MKAIKIIGMSIMTLALTGTVTAQRGVATTTVSSTIGQEYITDVKTLASYFKNNEIPSNFPKHDETRDEEGNAKVALKWIEVPANYSLLSDAGIQKLNEYKAKKAAKVAPMKR